jgi:hypothetical protein
LQIPQDSKRNLPQYYPSHAGRVLRLGSANRFEYRKFSARFAQDDGLWKQYLLGARIQISTHPDMFIFFLR